MKKFKIYEKNQEEIKYRKAKLLIEAAVKRRPHANLSAATTAILVKLWQSARNSFRRFTLTLANTPGPGNLIIDMVVNVQVDKYQRNGNECRHVEMMGF